jgi:hypothetical protein
MAALVLFEACSYIDEEGGGYGRRLFKKNTSNFSNITSINTKYKQEGNWAALNMIFLLLPVLSPYSISLDSGQIDILLKFQGQE